MGLFDLNFDYFVSHLISSNEDNTVTSESFNLAREGNLRVQWAPIEYVPPSARLAIVGITPGRQQANNALRAFQDSIAEGHPREEALRRAKSIASFSGGMRNNLVEMLDSVGVNDLFAVPSCHALFEPERESVHFTSALRYPVFRDGKNYHGTPRILGTPILRQMVETFLAEEARTLHDSFWLPLGSHPTEALHHLVAMGVIPAHRVLPALPHPR